MPKNPYEWIYETESQPLKEYVLDVVAKQLAIAAEQFPPRVEEWERPDLQARFAPLLEKTFGRPRLGVLRVSLKLYRWELEREVEAIDQFMRNNGWEDESLDPTEVETAIFLWHYWVDQTLAFKEYAGNKFKHAELIGLADRIEVQLIHRASPLRGDA